MAEMAAGAKPLRTSDARTRRLRTSGASPRPADFFHAVLNARSRAVSSASPDPESACAAVSFEKPSAESSCAMRARPYRAPRERTTDRAAARSSSQPSSTRRPTAFSAAVLAKPRRSRVLERSAAPRARTVSSRRATARAAFSEPGSAGALVRREATREEYRAAYPRPCPGFPWRLKSKGDSSSASGLKSAGASSSASISSRARSEVDWMP